MAQLFRPKPKKESSVSKHPENSSQTNTIHVFHQIAEKVEAQSTQSGAADLKQQDEQRGASNIGRETTETWNGMVEDGVEQSRNGQYSEALKSFQSALKEQRAGSGQETDHAAHTLANIGSVYLKQGRIYLAAEALEEAHAMQKQLRENGSDDKVEGEETQLVHILNNLGNVALLRGDHDASITYYQEALQEAHTRNSTREELANILYNVGRLSTLKGDWNAALSVLTDALKLQKELYGEESELIADTLELIGFNHLSLNAPDHALVHFSEALAIYQNVGGAVNSRVATSLVHVGMVLEKRGQLKHAWHTFAAARDVFAKAGVSPDNRGYRAARRSIANIKKAVRAERKQKHLDPDQLRFKAIESREDEAEQYEI